jgi:hypothetical protein
LREDPISKITSTRWTGGVAQAVECFLCKCRVLSSNPSPAEKKKKLKNTEEMSLYPEGARGKSTREEINQH